MGIYEVKYKSYAVMNKRFKKIYCKIQMKASPRLLSEKIM